LSNNQPSNDVSNTPTTIANRSSHLTMAWSPTHAGSIPSRAKTHSLMSKSTCGETAISLTLSGCISPMPFALLAPGLLQERLEDHLHGSTSHRSLGSTCILSRCAVQLNDGLRFGPRFKWPSLVMHRSCLARDFGVSEALAKKVIGDMLETKSIMLKVPEVEAEHRFVEAAEQMKFFDADVSALESALEQAPEIFESVGVDAAIGIPSRVVNDLVFESLLAEPTVRHERIGVECASKVGQAVALPAGDRAG